MSEIRILYVEDEEAPQRAMRQCIDGLIVGGSALQLTTAYSYTEALDKDPLESFDVAFIDLKLLGRSGRELLDKMKKQDRQFPCVVVTATGSTELAVELMRDQGLNDYVVKPVRREVIEQCLLRLKPLIAMRRLVRRRLRERKPANIVLESSAIKKVWNLALRAAEKTDDVGILLLGQTGVGKGIFARAIHTHSTRKSGTFEDVSVAALDKQHATTELFGNEKGAYTGAQTLFRGRFELAEHGTIFLDEIGDASPDVQVRLLKVLREKFIRRLHGEKDIPTDVRVITATNQDLKTLVRAGKFREDLYHRINELVIEIPPLCARKEDILPLARLFLSQRTSAQHFSDEAEKALLGHSWPGNAAELQNVVVRSWLSSDGAPVISEEHLGLTPYLERDKGGEAGLFGRLKHGDLTWDGYLDEMKRRAIKRALGEARGDVKKAAEILGIAAGSLHRLLTRLGLRDKQDEA